MSDQMPDLFAWVGEDEFGSGEIGLKQARCPAGFIPLVAVHKDKMTQAYLLKQLQDQAARFGKTIRFCRYRMEEVIVTLNPVEGKVDHGQTQVQ